MNRYIATLLLAFSGSAFADNYIQGGLLLKSCESQFKSVSWTFCSGYLTAAAEITAMLPESGICVPEEPWQRDLHEIFTQYANLNPEKLNGDARHLVMAAFKRSYPC